MTLNKIQDFAKTRDASAFSSAIESRVENGKLATPSLFVAQTATHQSKMTAVA